MIDYRHFAPDSDGKIKLDPVAEMLAQLALRGISYRTMLMDSWYATTVLFKWLLRKGKTFYCPLKNNRLDNDSGGQQSYQSVAYLYWSSAEVEARKTLKVKGMPKNCKLKR